MPKQSAEVCFINSDLFAQHGGVGVYSTRHGGVSTAPFDSLNIGYDLGDDNEHVETNLHRFLKATGLSWPHTSQQCHTSNILYCEGPGTAHNENADILITKDPNASIGVRTADCVPILLADPCRRVLAVVHAGWRGTAIHAVKRAVLAMQSCGSNPSEILASVGPAIGKCCYAISDDVAEQLGYPFISGAFARIDNHIHADLAQINIQQLSDCGIPSSSIEHIAACTSCHSDRFFSYRRDHGHTGRHLAVAAWA